YSDIPLVPKSIGQPADVLLVVFFTILLRDQNLFVVPVPPPGPVFVRPAQAEGEVRLARHQDLGKGAFEEAFALKPIMVVTEPVYAVFPGQVGLRLACFGQTEVVEAQVRRQMRLAMPAKQRPRSGDVGPLREAFSPPFIVLGNGMELREIKRDQAHFRRGGQHGASLRNWPGGRPRDSDARVSGPAPNGCLRPTHSRR